GNALNPASAYRRGFHPTGVAGVFGAATGAAKLLGLDSNGLASAIAISGTLASGSLEFLSDGTWTKRLNAGWAAHSGVFAARLAAEGFGGPLSAIEGPHVFLRAYTDDAYSQPLLEGLGQSWAILSVAIKPFACCR